MDILKVARRARVSTATVSRVINGFPGVRPKTLARVRKAIAELNYIPNPNARNLRIGRTRLYGLVVSDVNNPFFPELIDAFEALAGEQGIDVIFTHTNYDRERLRNCVRRMVERGVDGIAVMTSEMDDKALQQAVKAGVPIVLMNQRKQASAYPNVRVDYTTGFREALDHLLELGHRDIGFIAGPKMLNSAQRRRSAFLAALRAHGLHVRSEWIATGDMRVEGGRAAMKTLLACSPRPTAVLATNDLMAVGALQAVGEAKIHVPRDLSLIGFDDVPIANMVHPPLTTIRHPRDEVAARAFAWLQQSKQNKEIPTAPALHPHLVVRKSTTVAPERRKV